MRKIKCCRCKNERLETFFPKDLRRSGARKTTCHYCLTEHNKQKRIENPAHAMFIQAKSRSKRKGINFNIEESDIIVQKTCPALGIELKCSSIKRQICDNSPTLDRVNPLLGYVKGNVKVISWRANKLKGEGTLAEHEALVKFLEDKLSPSISGLL